MIGLQKKDTLIENFSMMENVWREKKVYARQEIDANKGESTDNTL